MFIITTPKNGYDAALYLRLSKDEDIGRESNSIANQRAILTEYAIKNGYRIVGEYVDDGVSGTTFDRAGFQQMMSDIKDGKINMVITKDLSRLGREHIGTGQYIEQIFPRLNVRFIAIGDNYDSMFDDEPSADMVPMINFFNEFHAKQTSRKTRATKKMLAQSGKFQGSKPPFGYVRDPENKYHLLVDSEAAEVVKFIFQLACDGSGYKAISRHLRDNGYLNPNAYVNAKDPEHHAKSDYWKEPHDWHPSSIKTILHNPTYLGKIVSGRRKTKSFKCKEVIHVPEDEWIVVDGMHEAIISHRTWDLAHEKLKIRKRCDNHGAIQIFAGLVRCADCGYALAYTNGDKASYYQCSQYNVKGKQYCTSHYIRYDELYAAVLHDIRRRAKSAAEMDGHLLMVLKREAGGAFSKKLKQAEKQFCDAEQRITELDNIISRLYEDSVLKRITADRFGILLRKYEGEQSELKLAQAQLKDLLDERQSRQDESEQFMEMISAYKDITELNAPILNELIESIEVGPISKISGEKHRNIRIKYRQYCYVEIESHSDPFGSWNENTREMWRQIDTDFMQHEAAI